LRLARAGVQMLGFRVDCRRRRIRNLGVEHDDHLSWCIHIAWSSWSSSLVGAPFTRSSAKAFLNHYFDRRVFTGHIDNLRWMNGSRSLKCGSSSLHVARNGRDRQLFRQLLSFVWWWRPASSLPRRLPISEANFNITSSKRARIDSEK